MPRFVTIIVCLASLCFNVTAQDVCVQARTVFDRISTTHIQPRTLDDSYSKDVFNRFFKILDRDAKFFIAADIDRLAEYKNQLDDQNYATCDFVDKARMLYRDKVQAYVTFVDSLMAHPMNFKKAEYGPLPLQKDIPWSSTTAELKAGIIKDLKLDVLGSMYRQASPDTMNLIDPKAFIKFEPVARQRIKKNTLAELVRLLKDEAAMRKLVESSYLKALAKVFDPHSDYFSPQDNASFSEALDPEEMSFGISLEESTPGEVKVSNVVPGGPAWNSNQVNKGDVIVGVRWTGSGEYVDLVDLESANVKKTLGKQGEVAASITVRKPTGEMKEVKLVKQKLENEENIVSGFLLKGQKMKRTIGYISLPGFFTDDNAKSKGCAAAVTKELLKLKRESIEGLILDLRFNGGGSLQEAIELIGIFIDVGPIGILELAKKPPVTLKDVNIGMVYDGPLVIMVNGASGSASELVASALQDYRRAIIVGSTTYGKASGQNITPVDEKDLSKGFLKVTELRLYHITGATHQGKGVVPDVPLPDIYSTLIAGEADARFALKPLSINKKVIYKEWPGYPADIIKAAVDKSASSDNFKHVSQLSQIVAQPTPLESREYIKYQRDLGKIVGKTLSGRKNNNASYEVTNNKFTTSALQGDTYRIEMSNEVLNQIRSSIYIQEVYQLLDNVITKKP
jgi:carboxyl-terminal processing protease